MHEILPENGMIRKLWIGEADQYRDHLLRLDPESRRTRFGGGVADEYIARHAAGAALAAVIHGFFLDGTLRGAAELRRVDGPLSHKGEAAFSVEQPWQSHGIGSLLLERTLLAARNRGINALHMVCLADNRRMQQLAAKYEADLSFDFGSVVGAVDPPQSTPLSLMRELVADGHGIASAVLDAQTRLLKPV